MRVPPTTRAAMPKTEENYHLRPDGVYVPEQAISHRNEEYDETRFEVLLAMQQHHFWYRGRHRFILHATRNFLGSDAFSAHSGIDLGGGCGGWIRFLREQAPGLIPNLALGDSSLRALDFARSVVDPGVARYQIDLLRLQWSLRWDAVFLLDVLEHIPQDIDALAQIYEAMTRGGYLFVTTPALRFFWSYNDVVAEHQRRYSRADFQRLAEQTGFELCDCRYFNFFLSPLLYLSRLKDRDFHRMSKLEVQQLVLRTHRIPIRPVNSLLSSIFALETPLGHRLHFPWGTSILGVFRKR